MLLIFSSSLSVALSLPGIHLIWNALSNIVSLGPGGVDAIGLVVSTAEAMLLLPLVWDESAEDRPCAAVQPSTNWFSYVEAGEGRSEGSVVG